MLQPKDLLDVLDLLILHDLIVLRLTNVEQLSSKWKDTIVVTTNDTKTCDRKGLGRVSFRQDECAVGCLPRSCVVCVGQFGETLEPTGQLTTIIGWEVNGLPIPPLAVSLLQLLVCLSVRPVKNLVNDRRFLD